MKAFFNTFDDAGSLLFSNEKALMHLVKVCKPIYSRSEEFKLGGAYKDDSRNGLRYINGNPKYRLYYIDVVGGIYPICAVYKGAFSFAGNEKTANGVRIWLANSSETLDVDQTVCYIYDVYQNGNFFNQKAGLRMWDINNNLCFFSGSYPINITHKVSLPYNTKNNVMMYDKPWQHPMPDDEKQWDGLYGNWHHRSKPYQLNPNKKYATIIPPRSVARYVQDPISIIFYTETYSGNDGYVHAMFVQDVFMEQIGIGRNEYNYYARRNIYRFHNEPATFGGDKLTRTPPILCVDVTHLPFPFN